MNQMMFTLSDEQDEGKIPLLIVLAVVEYHPTGRYGKIPCRSSSLSGNTYTTEWFSRLITQTLTQTRRPGCGLTERECLKSDQLQSTSLYIVKNK